MKGCLGFFKNKREEGKRFFFEDKKTAVSRSNNKNEARETGMPPRVSKPGTQRR